MKPRVCVQNPGFAQPVPNPYRPRILPVPTRIRNMGSEDFGGAPTKHAIFCIFAKNEGFPAICNLDVRSKLNHAQKCGCFRTKGLVSAM